MEGNDWHLLKGVFNEARALALDERDAFLDRACAEHPALREQVEALLSADEGAEGFLELPTRAELSSDDAPPLAPSAPAHIGGYRIEELISAGGMGAVYRAIQQNPRRTVAIKIMSERFASRSARRRFEYESQILARLTHPHISQVFEAGTHREAESELGGIPYFVMEYVPDALPITEYAERQQLSVEERLRLLLQLCDAVHYGHQKGVIHRDIKPANVLVDASGQVKVIDFGVARATDADIHLTTAHTGVGQLLGTLQYMSPEQCAADPHDIDIRSDVYSLGVVLYELLCGALPYEVGRVPVFEATRVICEAQPRRPSTIHRALRGDVETIALKALEKERDQRYQTVAELGADIRRFLRGEVILARPAGPVTRAFQRIRRNPVLRATTGVAVVAVAAFVAYVLLISLPQIRGERDIAQTQTRNAEQAEAQALAALGEARLQREAALAAESAAQDEADLNAAINDFVRQMLSAPGAAEGGRNLKVAEVLDRAAARIEATYADQPRIEAELRSTLGWTYKSLGLYPEAEAQLRLALEVRRRLLEDQTEPALWDTVALAEAEMGVGRYEEARATLEGALGSQTLGAEHRANLYASSNLGRCLTLLDRHPEAEALLRSTYESQVRELGQGERQTLLTGGQLASTLLRLGRYAEAEEIAREVHQHSVEALGAQDPDTVSRWMTLASALSSAGKSREAEAIYRQVIEQFRQRDGEEHPDTVAAMERLAVLLAKRAALEEAGQLFEKVLEISRRTRGEEHPATLGYLNNLATVYATSGQLERARGVFEELVELRLRLQGPEHSYTLGAQTNLATVLARTGEPSRAEALYRELLEVRERVSGPEHPHTIQVRVKLVETLTALGRGCEAAEVARPASETLARTVGALHPRTLRSQMILARALVDCGRLEEADEVFAQALDGTREADQPEDILVANLRHYRGRCLMELERYEEAEPLMRAGHDLYASLLGTEHGLTLRAAESLALLYEAWGRPAEAAEWRAKLGEGQ